MKVTNEKVETDVLLLYSLHYVIYFLICLVFCFFHVPLNSLFVFLSELATWPARIYRIDEGQENLMLIGDIIEDGIHILDLTKKDSISDDGFQLCVHKHNS